MKKQINAKAWLVQDKYGKMRRSIWFDLIPAQNACADYQEVVLIVVSWSAAPIKPKLGGNNG